MNIHSNQSLATGVFVIDKPIGMSSHDVVQVIRHGTGIKRSGHTGTLDPRASGVLVVLLGSAVRLSEYLSAADKQYQATIHLGKTTDTYDSEGVFTSENDDFLITEEAFSDLLKKYIGTIDQVPPPYSAIKVKGKRAYKLAREGKQVSLKARQIIVHNIELIEWSLPDVVIDVHCSSGTYIRSLAHDLGKDLGVGAYLTGLRRTQSGTFSLRNATSLAEMREAFQNNDWYKYLIPTSEALSNWKRVELSDEEVSRVQHGLRIQASETDEEMACGFTEQGDLVAILQYIKDTNEWQPKKVLMVL